MKALRIWGYTTPFLILGIILAGFLIPFEDKEGRCTVCGLRIFEKHSKFLKEPITKTLDSEWSEFYVDAGLPEHEHQWVFVGGITKTNLYGFPTEYQYEVSDPIAVVMDACVIEILLRLEKSNAQIELLRALNCDDEDVSEKVRGHVYEACPTKVDEFLEWWEIYIMDRKGVVPSSALPGPVWEYRVQQAPDAEKELLEESPDLNE